MSDDIAQAAQHIRISGGLLIGVGALALVAAIFVYATMGIAVTAIEEEEGDTEEGRIAVQAVRATMGTAAAIAAIFGVGIVVGGIGMLSGATWGKVAGYIAAGMAAINIPLGTAAAVYAFYALTRPGADEHFGDSHATA